ncbi:ABC transporter permease [Chloroflexota bacterium]
MRSYIIRRLILIVPTVVLVTIIVFGLVRFIPGTVIDLMVAEMAQESGMLDELTVQYLMEELGLDVPVYVQYGRWVGVLSYPEPKGFDGLLQGSLGDSLWRRTSITEQIAARLPVSLELGFFGIITAILIALPIGIYSAMRQDTAGDYVGRTIAILAIALPNFWLATMVIVYPSIWWNWTPSMQYIPFVEDPIGNLGMFILPGIIMGMYMSGNSMRMTRTMMLEVLRQDYIRTAWSKGLPERTVIMRHAMKNAMIPVVTLIGQLTTIMIAGSVVLENIFVLPGVGALLIEALNKRDYPVISGINLTLALFVLSINLLIDLTYAWLDPRISYK